MHLNIILENAMVGSESENSRPSGESNSDEEQGDAAKRQEQGQEKEAVAQAGQARAELMYQTASLAKKTSQVRVAEGDLTQAKQDLARYTGTDPAAITRQQLEQSQATTKSAFAKLDSAKQAVQAGEAQVASQRTKIDAAQASARQSHADVDNAKLQLSYTEVLAPQAGKVTRRTVNL